MTRAKLRLAQACRSHPNTNVATLCTELDITRQTFYRQILPTTQLRVDGQKILTRQSKEPACWSEYGSTCG